MINGLNFKGIKIPVNYRQYPLLHQNLEKCSSFPSQGEGGSWTPPARREPWLTPHQPQRSLIDCLHGVSCDKRCNWCSWCPVTHDGNWQTTKGLAYLEAPGDCVSNIDSPVLTSHAYSLLAFRTGLLPNLKQHQNSEAVDRFLHDTVTYFERIVGHTCDCSTVFAILDRKVLAHACEKSESRGNKRCAEQKVEPLTAKKIDISRATHQWQMVLYFSLI